MIRIAICDDEKEYIKLIREMVEKFFNGLKRNIVIKEFNEGAELIQAVNIEIFDLILLDIRMPETSGLTVANKVCEISGGYNLIFISNEEQMVFEAIHYHPYRFVRKTRLVEELNEALQSWEKDNKEDFLHIKCDNRVVELKISEVLYICSDKHYLNIYTKQNEYKVRGKISDYNDLITYNNFILSSKSFLVNMKYIKNISGKEIILINGETIYIARSKESDCKEAFMKFVRSK